MTLTTPASLQKTTSHRVVVPFYLYGAIAFLVSCILLLLSTDAFGGHHFQPRLLAITHLMALGWGVMIVLGASHQLVPVLIEGELFSEKLAYGSFALAALGIPLLVYGFFRFEMGPPSQAGAVLVNAGLVLYLVNLIVSIGRGRNENVHAVFMATAAMWLFLTTMLGLLLVFNFTLPVLSRDSLRYLSLHAHLGLVGWFLLLILGVASRLLPMFLISKYVNAPLLWWVFGLINAGLVLFAVVELRTLPTLLFLLPAGLVLAALLLFGYYCREAYRARIRRAVDAPVRVSLLSVAMVALPLVLIVALVLGANGNTLVLIYGFSILFGWITAIILGMTFKTLPFIIWNKVYQGRLGAVGLPTPKELYSDRTFRWMTGAYLAGFVVFMVGLALQLSLVLKLGAVLLLLAALLYNRNVLSIAAHRAKSGS